MSSSSEVDSSEEQRKRPGFIQSVMQALSGSRFPTSEERGRKSPSPTFEEQDAGMSNRILDPAGFSEELASTPMGGENLRVIPPPTSEERNPPSYSILEQERRLNGGVRSMSTGNAKPDAPSPCESPLAFYSDRQLRQLGIELDPNAGRHASVNFVGRHSQVVSPSLHQQSAGGYMPGREIAFSDPVSRGFVEQEFRSEIPRQFTAASSGYRVFSEEPSPRLGRNDGANVTHRDAKRPKERSRDKAYKQRFSMGSSVGMAGLQPPVFSTCPPTNMAKPFSMDKRTPVPPEVTSSSWEDGYIKAPAVVLAQARASGPSSTRFEICLTHSGNTVLHLVWDSMPIYLSTFDGGEFSFWARPC
jgi:hypothetical protein